MNSNLESFLNEVQKHIAPAKEKTIFALGGRGYYENPASDLLKFFLNPNAEHGLKDLFLSTFLECMGEGFPFNMNGVYVEREKRTVHGNKIDLQVLGEDWCLIIENKIDHEPFNDFKDYEAHAEKFRKEKSLFSLLSPNGIASHSNTKPTQPRWG